MIEQNHECYVSLEVARLLKEAGFDWKITSYYVRYYEGDGNDDSIPTEEFRLHISDNIYCTDHNNTPLTHLNGILHRLSAPTLEVAQRWLREVKNFDIYVCPTNGLYFVHIRKYLEPVETKCEYSEYPNQFVCHTYEEALEAGIKKALEIILEKGE